jgi:hypothetical protein
MLRCGAALGSTTHLRTVLYGMSISAWRIGRAKEAIEHAIHLYMRLIQLWISLLRNIFKEVCDLRRSGRHTAQRDLSELDWRGTR